jgi:hypothetical protein
MVPNFAPHSHQASQFSHHIVPGYEQQPQQPQASPTFHPPHSPRHAGTMFDLPQAFEATDFSSYELTMGCGHGDGGSIHERMMAGDLLSCICGENCACFACRTHPSNRTTVNYVRYHSDLLEREAQAASFMMPQYGLPQQHVAAHYQFGAAERPSFPHQVAEPFASPLGMDNHNAGWTSHAQPAMVLSPTQSISDAELDQWRFQTQQSTMAASTGMSSFDEAAFSFPPVPSHLATLQDGIPPKKAQHGNEDIQQPAMSPTPFNAESPLDDETSTLSPSSFLVQDLTLEGCDGVTGSCRCGDGCQCNGCLTHGDHQDQTTQSSATEDNLDGFSLNMKLEKRSCCG